MSALCRHWPQSEWINVFVLHQVWRGGVGGGRGGAAWEVLGGALPAAAPRHSTSPPSCAALTHSSCLALHPCVSDLCMGMVRIPPWLPPPVYSGLE